nr:ABC transporter C family member 3 [Fagopyrum tataricum]
MFSDQSNQNMVGLWNTFCNCSPTSESCGISLAMLTRQNSCANHIFIIFCNSVILGMLIFTIVQKTPPKPRLLRASRKQFLVLQLSSAALNCCIGLAHLICGFWILDYNWERSQSLLPSLSYLVLHFFKGFVWMFVGLTVSLKGPQLPQTPLRVLSIFAFVSSAIIFLLSLYSLIVNQDTSPSATYNVLTFFGACLMLLCTYKSEVIIQDTLLSPLLGDDNRVARTDSSLFSEAGFFSRMTFWWLNPLMKKGKKKPLEHTDIPKLQDVDRAESCFLHFMDQYNKQKQIHPSSQSTILKAIIWCHYKEILISGFFAMMKILTLSTGPLLLNAFINIAQGKKSFGSEGVVLALVLFVSKTLESLSQRQWYFRSKVIGLKLRSLLTAAIYKKQQRLSNAAKTVHSGAQIMNYVTVDAYRIGEFPFWFHQTWTTILQISIAVFILFNTVGLATIAALISIIIFVLFNSPLARKQHSCQTKLMAAQDARLKTCTEALVNMKVLKLYAWETHFKNAIESLRKLEYKWISRVQLIKGYNMVLFWVSPVFVSAATFGACYFLKIPLNASNVFTFIATIRLLQEPIRCVPDVIAVVIQANVAFSRIVKFLEAPEIQSENIRRKNNATSSTSHVILMKSASLSWEENPLKAGLRDINLTIRPGEKMAICGEVGSGKSTFLAAILGEMPNIQGTVQVFGKIAYVPQTAWIQTGTIRENILFGSTMDEHRYQQTLESCSLLKDLELIPYGDMTEIGERGINLSGGQKQRIQLARALYHNADIYLLDDPFSAVDAQTATNLFNEYVMEALSSKTVLLVTHQVDFLPAFDNILLMSDGEIHKVGSYNELISSSPKFIDLVNAHKETAGGTKELADVSRPGQAKTISAPKEIKIADIRMQNNTPTGDQLIKKEERESGDIGFKPYILYLNQNKGYWLFSIAILAHFIYIAGQIAQSAWMAANIDNHHVTTAKLIVIYLVLGLAPAVFLLFRSLFMVITGLQSSKSFFSKLLNSLFRAPMAFYDSTPLGRILSRVSSDLNMVDLDVPNNIMMAIGSSSSVTLNLAMLIFITWQVLFFSIPMMCLAFQLQRYYFATAKELMRINGTTKSLVASHLAESLAGAMTIRAFEEENRFYAKNLDLIDTNATPFFHNFSANEWLILRLETLGSFVLASAALFIVLLPPGTFSPGIIGMALSFGLSLNISLVMCIQNQCTVGNNIISVERLNQYMYIPSEAPEVLNENRPSRNWPTAGKVEILDLQVRYRPDSPLVLRGITCTFQGGHKIGIVGRTGSGKTTLIGALFRLVEPAGGKIIVDGIDLCSIGLHDLRSRFGIIPQDPTLFNGTVRFNLDPLSQHTDQEIWEVLGKCQLRESVQAKGHGLDYIVAEDGSNWSMGQRQLFCLGRALLRRSRILVLDEATASIDNATDMILQKSIRTEFADCTVITVAHRIPTVMDCTMVLSMADGKIVEYDVPTNLMGEEGSLFGQLVKEYWSHIHSAKSFN